MTSPIWRVRLMVGRRVMTPKMNGSIPLPATMGRMSPYSIRKDAHSMKKFLRLTSVFLCCALLSSFLVVPASATSIDLSAASGSYNDRWNGASGSEPNITFTVGNAPLVYKYYESEAGSLGGTTSLIQYSFNTSVSAGSQFSFTVHFPLVSCSYANLTGSRITVLFVGSAGSGSSYSRSACAVQLAKGEKSVLNGNKHFVPSLGWDPLFSGDPTVTWSYSGNGSVTGATVTGTLLVDFSGLVEVDGQVYYDSPSASSGYNTITFGSLSDISFVAGDTGGGGDNPGGGGDNPGGGDTPGGDTSGLATLAEQLKQSGLLSALQVLLSDVYKVCDENRSYTYACNMQLHDFVVPFLRSIKNSVESINHVLSNQQDSEIVAAQKENVEQVKDDFLTGQSGQTSLGKGDFKSLSSVGGTFKDTISLNGQSSITDLTSGLSDADSVGQGWFSQATKDSLDAVSGSGSSLSAASVFSADSSDAVEADPDPYHMQGFENNYAWLWGDG